MIEGAKRIALLKEMVGMRSSVFVEAIEARLIALDREQRKVKDEIVFRQNQGRAQELEELLSEIMKSKETLEKPPKAHISSKNYF